MVDIDNSTSFLDVESPDAPAAVGAEAPLAPDAPFDPMKDFIPYATNLLDIERDDTFFNERIQKLREKKAEELSKKMGQEANEIFGQDYITVTDINKFKEAMQDIEDLDTVAGATSEFLDTGYKTYLKYTYGVTDLQAEALGDYFTSGSYKTGDIPTVMEGARPSPDFIGPMPPEYYGRTPVGVEGVRPSPDFIGPMPVGEYVVEGAHPSADFIGPMPPETLTLEEYEAATSAADKAASIGATKEEVKGAIDEAIETVKPAVDLAKKAAVTAAAFLALDNFVDDPNVPNAVIATGATATAVSQLTSLAAGVQGPPTQIAALSTEIASIANPISLFIAGTQILDFVMRDQDYRRSSAEIEYKDGKFIASNIGGHDAGSINFADGQSKTVLKMIDVLQKEYGFIADEAVVNSTLSRKGYLSNNVQYGKQGAGMNTGSIGASDLIYSLMREGALKVSANTPEEILTDPNTFIGFIDEFQKRTQDEYAKYMWANYDGKEDFTGKRGKMSKGYIVGYAAYGSENLAKAQVSMLNDNHSVKLEGAANVGYKFTKNDWSVQKTDTSHIEDGLVIIGGYTPTPTAHEYEVESTRTKGKYRTPVEYTKQEAFDKLNALNSSASPYSKSFRKGNRSEAGQAIDVYAAAEVDGKYYIGSRVERLS